MADGYTVHIDEPLASRLKAAAEASGVSVEAHVRDLLSRDVGEEVDLSDFDVDERIAQKTLATGDGTPLEHFLPRLERFGRGSA